MANDDYLSAVATRLDAVLADGRGVDGSLGTDAQTRAITAGIFRRAASNAALDDPGFPAEGFDRAYTLRFITAVDDPTPNNPYQTPQFDRVQLVVTVGYAYSVGTSNVIDAQGTETQSGAALRPDQRAMSDGRRIKRALEFSDLRGLDTDPAMVEMTRGTTTWQDLGGGRSLGVTTFAMVLQSNVTTAYGP